MIGKNVKKYLEENGIKQAYISRQTGIPANILSERLSEKSALKAEELYLIARVLKVPLETFRSSD